MLRGKLCLWVLPFVLLCAGCNKREQPQQAKEAVPSSPAQQTRPEQPRLVACALITTDEVAAIQGATIGDAKSSAGPSAGMLMSQCYYAAKEPNQSVSLAVIQGDQQNSSGSPIRNYWEETIQRFAGQAMEDEKKGEEKDRPNGREEEEKRTPPKKVDGVGEQAYWSGNRFGGALYVLSKDLIIRVSVGGPDNEQTKIDKCKALAQKVIERT
jgi:hypothetical protein